MSDFYDPYSDVDLSQLGLLTGGIGAFGSTGLPAEVWGAGGGLYDWLPSIEDDDLTNMTKRVNLYKALQGLMFDSRTGYGAAVEQGYPTFNFPGLTAGEGVEQAGTAEAGSQAGEILGFDEEGNPIISTGSTGGGGGGGGGGGSRGGGMSMEQANRFLGSLSNSNRDTIKLIPQMIEQGQDPTTIKLQIQEGVGPDADPETLKMLYSTVDQAWEAAGVTQGTTLPKSSDLGTQVGKWGTVDPTKAYTPDNLPEDILDALGPDYLTGLDTVQRDYDQAQNQWNRFIKANKDDDLFQLWDEQPEVTLDALNQTRQVTPSQIAKPDDSLANLVDARGEPTLPPNGMGPTGFDENGNTMWGVQAGGAEGREQERQRADVAQQFNTSPQQQPLGEGDYSRPLLEGLLTAVNGQRGKNTPYATSKSGSLLDTAVEVDADEAKELGMSGWDMIKMVPGGKRRVYTTREGRDMVQKRRGAKRQYDQQVQSNQRLREAIARHLSESGRTPQRDDLRGRSDSIYRAIFGG